MHFSCRKKGAHTDNAGSEVNSRPANKPSMVALSIDDSATTCSSAESLSELVTNKIKENKIINQVELQKFTGTNYSRGRARGEQAASSSKKQQIGGNSHCRHRDDSVISATSNVLKNLRMNKTINEDLIKSFVGARPSRSHASSIKKRGIPPAHKRANAKVSSSQVDEPGVKMTFSNSLESDSKDEGLDSKRNINTRFEEEANMVIQEVLLESQEEMQTAEQQEARKQPANAVPRLSETKTIVVETVESYKQTELVDACSAEEQEDEKSLTSEPRTNSPCIVKPPCTVKDRNDESNSVVVKKKLTFNANSLNCLDCEIDDDNLWFDMSLEVPDSLDTFSYGDCDSFSSHYM